MFHNTTSNNRMIAFKVLLRDLRVLRNMLWIHIATLVAVLAGSTWYFANIGWPHLSWHQALYAVLRVITLDPSVPYEELGTAIARILYFALPLLTLITGLDLFRTVFSSLIERKHRTQEWETRTVKMMSRHIVVCGLGAIGSRITKELCKQGLNLEIAAIEYASDRPGVGAARMDGVPVIIGDARLDQTLKSAGIKRAACLVCAGDDDELNAAVYLNALEARPANEPVPAVLRCINTALAKLSVSQDGNHVETSNNPSLRIPDISDLIAARMLDSVGVSDVSISEAKIAVVGLGKVGYLVLKRLVEKHGLDPARLTLVDRKPAQSEMARIRRIKGLGEPKVSEEELTDFLGRISANEFTHIFVTTGSDLTYLFCKNSAAFKSNRTAVRTKGHSSGSEADTRVVAVNTTDIIAPAIVSELAELDGRVSKLDF